MQKWEYLWEPVAKFTLEYAGYLKKKGDEGWEFAGLFPGDVATAPHFVLFKRAGAVKRKPAFPPDLA